MRRQRGEILLALFVFVVFAGAVMFGGQRGYYEINKAEKCKDDFDDTSPNERKECYIEKKANEVSKTLTDIEN